VNVRVRTDGTTSQMMALLHSTPELMQALSSAMGKEAIDLVREGFRQETDPYGQKWQEKQVDDGRKVLHGESSNLRLGWKLESNGRGSFRLSPSVRYATTHQNGFDGEVTRKGSTYRLKIPARRMLPTSGMGIPSKWRDQLMEAEEESISLFAAKMTAGSGGGGGMSMITAKIAGIKRSLNIMAIIRRAFSDGDQ